MSFLFGKSKKGQSSALPAATRDITSSHGPDSRIPMANGLQGPPREGAERRGPPAAGPQTAGSSVNSSLNSVQDMAGPDSGPVRPRAESDAVTRPGSVRANERPNESPYPWSQRRLEFPAGVSPFPRYGAAINATASKEGWIYMMGGLINGSMVKGDLWMVEAASGRLSCFPVSTENGPSPRVGHASLLVGNAFIVFGGDTKLEDGDVLDDTLYLLNTSTKQWSRASPAGPRPAGRYGHTLNILGSKIYIFGGQVEGYFFNDLVAFDLNTLQSQGNKWEIMVPNGGDGHSPVPPPRTNHCMVTWQDKLYLFGGTDGTRWFNDVWTYDPRVGSWSELDCIGYIPAPREGHAAALVNDTMYIFGGRVQDGSDLGDLAAFRISTRRWYMFQNMGMSPSPRSGHSMTAYGKHIIVLGGEPSSAPRDLNELSWSYILDTSKIRYPPTEQPNQSPQQPPQQLQQHSQQTQQPQQQQQQPPQQVLNRKASNERPSGIPMGKPSGIPVAGAQQSPYRGAEPAVMNGQASRLPRSASAQGSSPQPMQQPRTNGVSSASRSRTPTQIPKQSLDSARGSPYDNEALASGIRGGGSPEAAPLQTYQQFHPGPALTSSPPGGIRNGAGSAIGRSGSRAARQQDSVDSGGRQTPRASAEDTKREISEAPVDSGVGSSPALSQQNDELLKELEAARSRNAWYAAELALAKKAGYQPSSSNNPILDQQAADIFADDDRPLIEALLRMRQEIARIQGSMDDQADVFAGRVAEVEKQRDAAISEAAYAKAKLAAYGGGSSQAGTPQPDAPREAGSPDVDRADEMARRLATILKQNNELNTKVDTLTAQVEAERAARQLAEETIEAAQQRVTELDSYRQVSSSEIAGLRAELHEAQRAAREEAATCAEALASLKLLQVDRNELEEKHNKLLEDHKTRSAILQSLRDAVNASSEKTLLLERKLDEERDARSTVEQKHASLKAQHEERTIELEQLSRRLRDTEELAEKHAEEARTHREAVLSGLDSAAKREIDVEPVSDERVTILQQQLESANAMARRNKDAADAAANRLRSAEERIAGLEAYQEQSSRDALTVRKQLQAALRDVQTAQAEKNEIQTRMERTALESNALQVQLSTLKNLLEERGVTGVDGRRSRALDSPNSRYGTPELNRVRELERQLDDSLKAHDELRITFEQREQEVAREWEEKLAALDNDHQGAVKYVRGLEKMLAKMKQELQKTKSANIELEKEIAHQKAVAATTEPAEHPQAAEWEKERDALWAEISHLQEGIKNSMAAHESQIATLKSSLAESESQRNALEQSMQDSQAEHESDMKQLTDHARAELESLRHQNGLLEQRARDAEQKVQLFLDQFENSVDNYRRMSRVEGPQSETTGTRGLHRHQDSMAGESMYSSTTEEDDEEHNNGEDGELTPSAHSFPSAISAGGAAQSRLHPDPNAASRQERDRSSMALDGLASELEALRTHWETTNKNYRLSDRFDFEKSPVTPSSTLAGSLGLGGLGLSDATPSAPGSTLASPLASSAPKGESLASWRKRLSPEDDDEHDEVEHNIAESG